MEQLIYQLANYLIYTQILSVDVSASASYKTWFSNQLSEFLLLSSEIK